MFSKIFACNGDWSIAFWASIVRCNLICDDCVVESLDEFISTVGAIGVLVSMPSNISKVWVKDSVFSSHLISLFQRFNLSWGVVKFVSGVISSEM